ncbi:L-rhamnose mutarotase [Mollicutes bacterium LVI A0039]|nr:L-rhamnose mutarotase [Mollicutes bacterium LVI A0039]
MKLKPGMLDEYKIRHNQVFPELEAEFVKAGVTDYTIWYDQDTDYLFAYVNLENTNVWNNIATTDACKRWWEYMAPLMETNPDNSPVSDNLTLAYDFII